jgi:hypothetical protein
MSAVVEASKKLSALQKSLPERLHKASVAVVSAETILAGLLVRHAAGLGATATEVARARKALALARQEHEDLTAISEALPRYLAEAQESAQSEAAALRSLELARAREVFRAALKELQNLSFVRFSAEEIKARGMRVRELAHHALCVQEFKDAIPDLAERPRAHCLMELI